ncbi:histone H3-K4 methyltransferase Set1 [Amniculicola lignicola CBS 123094]|uniref:Histone-lysine N-methyltransferase, H3 lysine-4 specific n=1 Tax=Amniculicola lignicola CBS 123094 TaxID=1392246 RepID=A0A6A5W7U6_9PLEO|nr:histone H3-K4 methyltransferase Set1 [Amniculicola lignicola CBS 123094]
MSRAPAVEHPHAASNISRAALDRRRDHASLPPRRAGSRRADSSVQLHSPASALSADAVLETIAAKPYTSHAALSLTPPTDDNDSCSGEVLKRVGSESSLDTPASAFSATHTMSYPSHTSLSALTPLTSTDSSPPGKLPSPRSAKPSNEPARPTATAPRNAPSSGAPAPVTMTPVHTPPETRIPMRPTDGKMGLRLPWDPDKQERKAGEKRPKPVYRDIVEKGDPSPTPDPRLAIAGYTSGNYVLNVNNTNVKVKTTLRMAPITRKPYPFDARISCGPGPSTQIVVYGFSPLLPESTIKSHFADFGRVEFVHNQLDPENGSPLGVCLVKYMDIPADRSRPEVKASAMAKRAEQESGKLRINGQIVHIKLDREGRKCAKLVARAHAHAQERSRRELQKHMIKKAPQVATPTTPTTAPAFDLPANVPKGPSGRGIQVRGQAPVPPPPSNRRGPPGAHLIEQEPIKPRLKRKPYLFIACQYVPVLGPTIAHLAKRLKSYHPVDVRCDRSGYFVIFEESKRGEEDTMRCFHEANMDFLFTYIMNMECCPYGDPDYERSPSPERIVAERKRKVEKEKAAEEEAKDIDIEKQERADELDPVRAAIDILRQEMHEKLLGDCKSRIAGPTLLDLMAPERLAPKRQKFNISGPQTKEEVRPPPAYFAIDSPAGTPNSRHGGIPGRFGRKALAPYEPNRVRGKKPTRVLNAFADERRKKIAPKRNAMLGMHRRLVEMEDPDSDDERQSSFTRDTEEQESQPTMSRAQSTDVEDEESTRAHRAKRRRIEAGWGEESDDDMMDDSHARSLLAHLIHKDPENMAEKELEQVLAILPRSSPIWKKADKALKGFRRLRKIEQEADAIFGLETEDKPEPEIIIDDTDALKPVQTTEIEEPVKVIKKDIKPPKSKRKTKKQLQEEAKAAAQLEATDLNREVEELPTLKEPTPAVEITPPEETPVSERRGSINWGVSSYEPKRTVEDDLSVVLDIDGWQHMLKDEEDLVMLRRALESTPRANIGDVQTWARKQKQIKQLNRPGQEGVSRTETKIEGYYVPNSTGSARTEGVKKIRESEKSKYLPHRIRVQKEREERERQAKSTDTTHATVEGFKFVAGSRTTSTANSRANRANNRRLQNDINISKNISGAEGDAMRFNQLKKRKKLVKFDRSAIHNWGLYAQESIAANDMIIEYVGEKVRQRVADLREAKYDMQGVGSSYLFRIDEDTVVDATKMGGIARFINHSCMPNCTAKIIRVDGTKRIVIYALRDISQDEELTYDYKFEREIDATDRIPCLCGSVGCKGFLN